MDTIATVYEAFSKGGRIVTDSREVKEGDIFIALKGENHNGNAFAATAIRQGAAFAVTVEAEYATDEKCLSVSDTLRFLQELARYHRPETACTDSRYYRYQRKNDHEGTLLCCPF